MSNRTFAIIKPDAVKNKYTGLIYDRILHGSSANAIPIVIFTCAEVSRLHWPNVWVSQILNSIPRRHQSDFIKSLW